MFVKEGWIRRAGTIDLFAYGKNIRLLRDSKYTFRLNHISIEFDQVMDYISISPYVNMILDGGKISISAGENVFQLVNTETRDSFYWVYPECRGFSYKDGNRVEFNDFDALMNTI